MLEVGLSVCALARDWVRETHRSDYDAAIAAVRECMARRAARVGNPDAQDRLLLVRLDKLGRQHRSRTNPAPVANMLCIAACNCEWNHVERALDSLRAIAVRVAKLLGDDATARTDYVARLDQWLMLAECRDVVRAYEPAVASTLSEVLFRADRGNGTAGHFIFRYGHGQLGLVTKLKGRYRVFTGDRESLLATLPNEELMAAATKALVER